MYAQIYEPLPDIDRYLRHMGVENRVPLTVDGLNSLISAHILTVPFEALDACPGKEVPPLDVATNYQRVVKNFRGGYCFQLNGLFCSLLNGLGFHAYSVAVKILILDPRSPKLHRGCIVSANGKKYYCDVGFGGPGPDFALCIEPGTHEGGFYVEEENGIIYIMRDGDKINPLFAFRDFPVYPEEFIPANYYCSKAPTSRFAQEIVVNKRTENGYRSLKGNVLRICENGETEERIIGEKDFSAILWEYFKIRYCQ